MAFAFRTETKPALALFRQLLSIMAGAHRGFGFLPAGSRLSRLSSSDRLRAPVEVAKQCLVECMNVKPGIEVASLSDVGCQRENNEDSYLYWEPAGDDEFQRKGRLAVIADGMGGHEGGQEASRLAVETVREVYEHASGTIRRQLCWNRLPRLTPAFKSTPSSIPHSRAWAPPAPPSLSATAQLYFAHVGDSRLYLVRDARILRLTRDHSYVGRLVESGIVRAEDAEKHPQRHILTAALGAGRELAVDSAEQSCGLAGGRRSPALHRRPLERRHRGRTRGRSERQQLRPSPAPPW